MSLQEIPLRNRFGMFAALLAVVLTPMILFAPKAVVGEATYHWFATLPPVFAIAMVLLTGRLLLSLLLGIGVGALIAALSKGSPLLGTAGTFLVSPVMDTWNLQVLGFIPLTLAMIGVIVTTGGFNAIVFKLRKWAKGQKSTQFTTFLAGLILFFDDYANTMIVGAGMRPLSDHHRISRHKLAFLVDATAAPIAGVALMSTWIGYEIGLFRDVALGLGLERDGFSMFLDALQFRFYCLMMLVFVVIHILMGKDYGPMAKAQKFAYQQPEPSTDQLSDTTSKLYQVLIPIGLVFVVMFVGLWLDGGGAALWQANPLNVLSFTAWQQVLIQVENSVTVLLYGAVLGFGAAILCGLAAGSDLTKVNHGIRSGLKMSALPMAILILAWSLKAACDNLGTGNYLVGALSAQMTPWLYPGILFLIAGLTAFATGTSWGTMAILIPTAIPLAYQLDGGTYGLITMICLGAVLDGAIFGDHCSPISDTTIMSSTATHCDHLEHVHTQLPYAITVGAVALGVGYVPAAMGLWGTGVSLLVAAVVIASILMLFGSNTDSMLSRSLAQRWWGMLTDRPTAQNSPSQQDQPVDKPKPATR